MNPTEKSCTKCGLLKSRENGFYKHRNGTLASWCKTCVRIGMNRYRRTAAYKATRTAYKQRDDFASRKRAIDRKRSAARKGQQRRYRSTLRARLLHCRRQALVQYRRTIRPERRARLMELVACYEAEIRRIDRRDA
jgi:hypothetical protein